MDFIGDIIATPFICFGWIIVGILAGALARSIMRAGNRPFWSDMVLGLIGAVVGGLIASLLGLYKPDDGLELVLANLMIATIGAMIVIGFGRMLDRA